MNDNILNKFVIVAVFKIFNSLGKLLIALEF